MSQQDARKILELARTFEDAQYGLPVASNLVQRYKLLGYLKDEDGRRVEGPLGDDQILVQAIGGIMDGDTKVLSCRFMPSMGELPELLGAWMEHEAGMGEMPNIEISIAISVKGRRS